MNRSLSLVAVALLAGLMLVCGCSSGTSSSTEKTTAPAASSPTTHPAGPPTTLDQHALPTQIDNFVAKRKYIVVNSCTATPGGWQAAGTAHNPGKVNAGYLLTIFFASPHGGTVLDYATKTLLVGPGQTITWTATAKFTPVPGMLCVLRGVG
jgi:hypothetical protein